MTIKKINPITIGEIITPKSNPNFIHNILNGVKILEFKIPKIKNINEIINDHIRKISPCEIGHKAIRRKTIKKTNPKLRLDGNLNSFILNY